LKRIFIALTIPILFHACSFEVETKDREGNSLHWEITEIGIRDGRIERKKDSLAITAANSFLLENKNDIAMVQNYFLLCDSSYIQNLRDFNVQHKIENITSGLDRYSQQIRPIPGVYSIEDGPFAEYLIDDEELGKFESYFIDLKLDKEYRVIDYVATVIFREKRGAKPFIKKIYKDEQYLIEPRINKKEKW